MTLTSKSDLIAAVASDLGLSKAKATEAVDAVLSNIASLARGGRLTIRGFGKFETRTYKARTVRSGVLGAGNSVEVPERTRIVFKAGKDLDQN